MKFENTQVMNFKNALLGMRNPKNSRSKSDSFFGIIDMMASDADLDIANLWCEANYSLLSTKQLDIDEYNDYLEAWLLDNGILQLNEDIAEVAFLGPKDMQLAQTLIRSGPEHRKFLRQIFVSVDITAPLYWWKEADTYKVGTTANSTSTMHTLTAKPITVDCFERDDYNPNLKILEDRMDNYGHPYQVSSTIDDNINGIIDFLEQLRQAYLRTSDKKYWKELIRWLPESWLQTRTWSGNYENLYSIYHQRIGHKLNEWNGIHTPVDQCFIDWVKTLPYAHELIICDNM